MTIMLASEYEPVRCGRDGCGQHFAMARHFYEETHRTGQTWYCPNGHPRVWKGQTTEQKLVAEKARNQHLADQLRAAIEEGEQTRQALLRDRQRFANGVCPCCNRSFTNVARHMATQHPDFDVTGVKPAGTRSFRCSCGGRFDTHHGLRVHQGLMRSDGWNDPGTGRYWAHLTVV